MSDNFDISRMISMRNHRDSYTYEGESREGIGKGQGDTETHSTLRHYATEKKKARADRWICQVISRSPTDGEGPPTATHTPPGYTKKTY